MEKISGSLSSKRRVHEEPELLADKYVADNIEIVEFPEISVEGAFDEAVKRK